MYIVKKCDHEIFAPPRRNPTTTTFKCCINNNIHKTELTVVVVALFSKVQWYLRCRIEF